MAFNFPNSPIEGQTFTPVGGYQYVYTDGKWRVTESPQVRATAEARNRVANGSMQISQENVDTSGTASAYYPADQWQQVHTGLGTITTGRTSGTSPPTGSRSIYTQITTAKGALAAGDFWQIVQNLEGIRMRDFQWGTVNAKQIVLRFSILTSSSLGTYTVKLGNSAGNKVFLAPFTISSLNTWTTVTIVIPGDTTGTWSIDNSLGAQLGFVFAAGTTYQGAAGWQATGNVAITGQTNGAAIAGAVFYVTDVGLYLDPNNTGLAPAWQMPDEAQEEIACMRYYERAGITLASSTFVQYDNTSWYKARKRISPALAVVSGNPNTGTIGIVALSPMDGYRQIAAATPVDVLVAANARM